MENTNKQNEQVAEIRKQAKWIADNAATELAISRRALAAFTVLLVGGDLNDQESGELNIDAVSVFLDGIDVHLQEAEDELVRALRKMDVQI